MQVANPATVKLRFEHGEEGRGATKVRPFKASLVEQPRTEAEVAAVAAAVTETTARERQLQRRLQTAAAEEQRLQAAEDKSQDEKGKCLPQGSSLTRSIVRRTRSRKEAS